MNKDNLLYVYKNDACTSCAYGQLQLDIFTFPIHLRAGQYEAGRICETVRKQKERKARANGSSSETLLSTLTWLYISGPGV